MKKTAIIAIPVYRLALSELERISLAQARRVLGRYDFCFLAPETLDVREILPGADVRVERFDDRFFKSQNTYSEMMLLPELYERFSDYEYMLIYQLDAFVFSDRLAEFCAMGYDYMGAPAHRWLGHWKDIGCGVGIGGLSLRKIDSMIRVLRQKEAVFQKKPASWVKNEFLAWEDLFFAFCSKIPELDYHIPDFHTALDFAVGRELGHAYEKMPAWMPFGCHSWNWLDYWHWKPLIERCGYQLPEPRGRQALHQRRCLLGGYVIHRLAREGGRRHVAAVSCFLSWLPEEKRIALWGAGKYGTYVAELLDLLGRSPEVVFDKTERWTRKGRQMPVVRPDVDRMREQQLFVIVTTVAYEDEICAELEAQGLQHDSDFVRLSDVMDDVLQAYLWTFRRE